MKLILLVTMLLSVTAVANNNVSQDTIKKKQTVTQFSKQWGRDALDIPHGLATHSAESLGLLPPLENQQVHQQIRPRTLAWNAQKRQAGNYWFDHINNSYINAGDIEHNFQLHETKHGVNAAYTHGRFSAETTIINQQSISADSTAIFLQGAYNIASYENLNVALTAQIESLGENQIRHYFGAPEYLFLNTANATSRAKNYTLGIVTTYSISKDWQLLGMLSATNLDDTLSSSPLIKHNNTQMALISTRYSF
ncbi:MipA/OmpV family protein [Thalassotalea sp. 1_MG-2023]|uniref:MipA/OmpV family protein n=1 Tax=Thalassotalea sp. 1_MG-2023 TaxID=3062680 RepID=UPI0026E16C5B|nr:MipA/OmpV family protein [Thalassotalea sp. 1_MG-2023]MDO6428186.1 MipA/OmpV family protein [Thalassotalea sp. 1_MG-2023]